MGIFIEKFVYRSFFADNLHSVFKHGMDCGKNYGKNLSSCIIRFPSFKTLIQVNSCQRKPANKTAAMIVCCEATNKADVETRERKSFLLCSFVIVLVECW